MKEAGIVLRGRNRLLKSSTFGMNVKRILYEGIAVPTALSGAKTWSMGVADKKEIEYNGSEMSKDYVWCNLDGW